MNAQTAVYPVYPAKIKPQRLYTTADSYFAFAALLLGFLTVKTYTMSVSGTGLGLMATVSAAAVSAFCFIYCRKLGMLGSRTTLALFIAELVLSLSFFTCDNGSVTSLCALFIFLSNAYFCYASYHEGSRSVLNNLFRAVIVSPFYEFDASFGAIFGRPKAAKNGLKNTVPLILGMMMSIPLCIVVAILLCFADPAFEALLSRFDLGEILVDDLLTNLLILVVSLPVGMYIFAAPYSRAYKMKNEDSFNKAPSRDVHVLPASSCAAFLTPLSIIYAAFTALQAAHLVTRTGELDYAEYARGGFFQLCAVAVINLGVAGAMMYFAKLEKKTLPKLLRGFIVIFSLLTHCLIITAQAKMLMYINIYGMTPKRVQTSVFMAYLFVMFAVLIAKQINRRISFTKTAAVLAAIVLALMAFIPVDALIAKYNIDKFRSGDIAWMGIDAMYELDASAYPTLAQIDCYDNWQAYSDVRRFFTESDALGDSFRNQSVWDFNLPRYLAGKAIAQNACSITKN